MREMATLEDYFALHSRFEELVRRWAEVGEPEDVEYCMANFFIFFEDFEKLVEFLQVSEEVLQELEREGPAEAGVND